MVTLTFPDGARRDYPKGTTGLDIAKGISPSLAKRTVVMALDGALADLSDPIERGFYYDFFRNQPFTLEDLPTIEKKMREIIARDKPFTKEVWSREQAKKVFRDKGEAFKVELIDAIPGSEPITIYKQGEWFDL